MLPDGRRLHLQHGPIDLIIEAFGQGRANAYFGAVTRFETVLGELSAELPALRSSSSKDWIFQSSVARRMNAAVACFLPEFITPMAAVAGAVADEIVAALALAPDIEKAYVNNGGDIAFYLTKGHRMDAAIASGQSGVIIIDDDAPYRGIATSGWRGRSHSLGIADAVTAVAETAALADAAATLIANAIDLPRHPAIQRTPACELSPDSDLGDGLVTTGVGRLLSGEIDTALCRGEAAANKFLSQGLIGGAVLMLDGKTRQIAKDVQEPLIHKRPFDDETARAAV